VEFHLLIDGVRVLLRRVARSAPARPCQDVSRSRLPAALISPGRRIAARHPRLVGVRHGNHVGHGLAVFVNVVPPRAAGNQPKNQQRGYPESHLSSSPGRCRIRRAIPSQGRSFIMEMLLWSSYSFLIRVSLDAAVRARPPVRPCRRSIDPCAPASASLPGVRTLDGQRAGKKSVRRHGRSEDQLSAPPTARRRKAPHGRAGISLAPLLRRNRALLTAQPQTLRARSFSHNHTLVGRSRPSAFLLILDATATDRSVHQQHASARPPVSRGMQKRKPFCPLCLFVAFLRSTGSCGVLCNHSIPRIDRT